MQHQNKNLLINTTFWPVIPIVTTISLIGQWKCNNTQQQNFSTFFSPRNRIRDVFRTYEELRGGGRWRDVGRPIGPPVRHHQGPAADDADAEARTTTDVHRDVGLRRQDRQVRGSLQGPLQGYGCTPGRGDPDFCSVILR